MKWVLFAAAAMFLFTFANVILKKIVNEIGQITVTNIQNMLPNLTLSFILLLILLIIFTLAGFVSMLKALEEGKVALVMAVVSLSTILLAFLSIFIFGDTFSVKEILAMALAIISILILLF
ncbi:EamA family transporter [Candidatus Micrarchaeota archaeon]|jgi:drug/metabolite transporter (DMT)-like permease|nr:EamA family transporter [Candidatus Micrarchaeota archaeon]